MDSNKREREKMLFRYTGALERGDMQVLQEVLRQAQEDSFLAQQIDEINAVYAAEESVPQEWEDLQKLPSHLWKGEKKMSTSLAYPQNRQRLPLSLVAVLATILLTMSILATSLGRNNSNRIGSVPGTATPVQPSATVVSSPIGLQTYQGVVSGRGRNMETDGQLREDSTILETHLWVELPDRVRYEHYSSYNSYYNPPEATAVYGAAVSVPSESDQQLVLGGIETNDGERHWVYRPDDGAPLLRNNTLYQIRYHFPVTAAGDTGFQEVIQALGEHYTDIRRLPDDSFLNRPVYVLEMKPLRNSQFPEVSRIVLKLDKEYFIKLSEQQLNAQDDVISETAFTELEINTPIDQTLFKLSIPDSGWSALPSWSSEHGYYGPYALIWADLTSQAIVPIYRVKPAALDEWGLFIAKAHYDPFTATTELQYFSRDGLYDPPALTVSQTDNRLNDSFAAIRSSLPTVLPAAENWEPITLEGVRQGFYQQAGAYHFLFFNHYGIQVALYSEVDRLTKEDLIRLAGELEMVSQTYPRLDLTSAWRELAAQSAFPVLRPILFETYMQGMITETTSAAGQVFSKLNPQAPSLSLQYGVIRQQYLDRTAPIVALEFIQGADEAVRAALGVDTFTGESISLAGLSGVYSVQGDLHWLILRTDETTLVFRAPVTTLSRDLLVEIASSLQQIRP
jgi:hypothetical protein